jgi:oxygen-independent coproporphyrinogen-3 oxidase
LLDFSVKEMELDGEIRLLQEAGLLSRGGGFFPSVHYPPITMYPPITQEDLLDGYELPSDGLFIVYAHIPFCRQYCTFCHYPNRIGDLAEEKDRYLDSLEREMDIYMGLLGLSKIRARSVLVGGGTPTYLSPGQLERFLTFFKRRVDMSSCTQFSWDVDPLTLIENEGDDRLRILREHGVHRLTIGIQSLNDEILDLMNRHHSAAEAVKAVRRSQEMGFGLNVELIFGFPGQTLEMWLADLEKAASLGVEEIQLYRLKVVPYGDHTGAITHTHARHCDRFADLRCVLLMKEAAIETLERRGYHENLTRVFTLKPEHYSHYAHDQCCRLADQVSFGLTAFSSFRDRFGLNTQSFEEYYGSIAKGRLPLNRGLVRTIDDQNRWHMILPLKNRSVLKKLYRRRTGRLPAEVFPRNIARLKEFGLLEENDEEVRLTRRGRFFADEVCHQFHHPSYIPFPRDQYAEGPLNPYQG